MKKIKSLILFSTAFAVAGVSVCAVQAGSSTADTIGVTLEQQENTSSNKVRYISTMTPVTDLDSITKIDINLTLSKSGETTKNAQVTTTTVYSSVTGTNGKDEAANTYYAVYTLTGLSDYAGWTLGATFEYFYSDTTHEETNTVSYTIPDSVTVTTGTGSFEKSSSISDCFTANTLEGGNIFHAWNWSMDTIKENLDDIYNAGYTTIQTSPMQPQKDYYAGNAQSDWWKFYQPLGFVVAPDSCNNALGTKSDLVEMVTAAHAKGIKVIVDVVANHLAGDYNKIYAGVAAYEPQIYGSNGTLSGGALLHSVGANGTAASDSGNVTQGHIYLPDLDTGNSIVQQRALSLLKEYIDCGVDGFRFDAAKHIETDNSSEPSGSSQFWPVVLNGATSYAQSKGMDKPYYYGEILYTCGNNRSYSWYTKYMDVIDNTTGNNITSTFNGGYATSASAYNTGCSADDVVLWAESHDTYSNESHETTFINQAVIDKSYAYSAARKGAQTLYFARPCGDNQFGTVGSDNKLKITCSVLLGDKGNWDAFKSAQITGVNKFHNYWGDASEWIDAQGSYSEIVRYNGAESGMVLINGGSGTSVSSLAVPSVMKDGTYKDYVTGNNFTVTSGKVSGTMSSCGIAVLYSDGGSGKVSIVDDVKDTFYTDTYTATYTIYNASSATLTVNGDDYGAITSGATVTFGPNMAVGDSITVSITADTTTESFTYTRIEAPTIYSVGLTKPEAWGSTVYAYMYNATEENAAWPGVAMTLDGDTYTTTYTSNDNYTNIVFSDGTYQSVDLELDQTNATYKPEAVTTIHFMNTVGWSTVNTYMWKDGATGVNNGDWPGVAISKDSTGYYAFDYNSTYDSIIFTSDGTDTNKTADLALNSYVAMYDYNGSAVTYYFNIVKNSCTTHTWDSGVVTTPATCEAKGVKTYTCTVCGATYTEDIPALGHDYDYDSEPTWVWNGFTAATAKFTCKNDSTHKESIAATITSETVDGVTTYTATVTVSGHTYTSTKVDDGSHSHDLVNVPAKAATCTTAGNYEYYYCAGCDTYFDADMNETTLEALTIAKTGHTSVFNHDATNHWHECSVCGEVLDTPEAHSYKKTTTAPTNGAYGKYTYTCDCGYSYEESFTVVYFTKPDGWGTPNIYAFGTVDGEVVTYNSKAWPGTEMTFSYTNDYGQSVYEFTINDPETYSTIIFTDGSNQTVDITLSTTANGYYSTGTKDGAGHYTVGTWYQA